jgi:alpha-mannosidase
MAEKNTITERLHFGGYFMATNAHADISRGKIYFIGHHHSDLVWRRTFEQYIKIREKQIFDVLRLLGKYPEFKFCFDQSVVLELFLKDHPELEDTFKTYIKSGRIEIVGGEISIPDTNMPNGEPLVRNLLLGRRWFRERFGVDVDIAWYMDAFGMSAQMPQILVKCGFKYLFPGRCPGVDFNKAKKGFYWKGIDGTKILCSTLEGSITAGSHICNLPIVRTKESELRWSTEKLTEMAGVGVFAGCCTEEELIYENAFEIIEEINKRSGRKIVFANPSEYYRSLEKHSKNLFAAQGDLNPEFTGCYTTRIKVKQRNRLSENMLLTAEKLSSIAHRLDNKGYPAETINNLWKEIAFCQFHDALCGCHIDPVTDMLLQKFDMIINGANEIVGRAASYICSKIQLKQPAVVFFNTTGKPRKDVVSLDLASGSRLQDSAGKIISSQTKDNKQVFAVDLPPFGYKSYYLIPSKPNGSGRLINNRSVLRDYEADVTKRYRIKVKSGELRIYDRELNWWINPVGTNFGEVLFREDIGNLWTEKYTGPLYSESNGARQVVSIEKGDVFVRVILEGVIERSTGIDTAYWVGTDEKSDINYWDEFYALSWNKEICFYHELDKIDFKLVLNWKGASTKVVLRFPIDIDPMVAKAYYEIPFGMVARKPYYEVPAEYKETIKNVATTLAQGDWPALRWVDYSDTSRGLTIANCGTPGHNIKGKEIQISLLRSPIEKASGFKPPIGSYDNGRHMFEFSILPHSSDETDYAKTGLELNFPVVALSQDSQSGELEPEKNFLSLSENNVILSTVKLAEDNRGYTIRCYETAGLGANLKLDTNLTDGHFQEMDLIEENSLKKRGVGPEIYFKPFEIKTLKSAFNGKK